jgi:hypothetical protein
VRDVEGDEMSRKILSVWNETYCKTGMCFLQLDANFSQSVIVDRGSGFRVGYIFTQYFCLYFNFKDISNDELSWSLTRPSTWQLVFKVTAENSKTSLLQQKYIYCPEVDLSQNNQFQL